MNVEKLYVYKVALALDRFLGAVIFRVPDVTLSTMMGLELRREHPRWWARLIGRQFLNRFWPNHCEIAIRYDAYVAWKTVNFLGFDCPEPTEKPR